MTFTVKRYIVEINRSDRRRSYGGKIGALEFLSKIPEKDMIIFLTSRTEEYSVVTEEYLKSNNIRYDQIIYGAPYGERILINDDKTSGLKMGFAINKIRDSSLDVLFEEDESL